MNGAKIEVKLKKKKHHLLKQHKKLLMKKELKQNICDWRNYYFSVKKKFDNYTFLCLCGDRETGGKMEPYGTCRVKTQIKQHHAIRNLKIECGVEWTVFCCGIARTGLVMFADNGRLFADVIDCV